MQLKALLAKNSFDEDQDEKHNNTEQNDAKATSDLSKVSNALFNDSVLEGDIMSSRYVSKLGKKIKYKPLKEGIMWIPKENCILFFDISIINKKTKNDNNKTREACSITGNMPILANYKGAPYDYFAIFLPIRKYFTFSHTSTFWRSTLPYKLLNNQNW